MSSSWERRLERLEAAVPNGCTCGGFGPALRTVLVGDPMPDPETCPMHGPQVRVVVVDRKRGAESDPVMAMRTAYTIVDLAPPE